MTVTPALISPRKALFMASAMFVSLAATQAEAVAVDTELVLLVDAQSSSPASFDVILEGVAQAFEQQSFVDSVATGPNGKIAATLIFFNSDGGENVRIPWMELSSAADLQGFADSVRNVVDLNPGGNVSYASAISTGAAQTASTAFEGSVRQLTVIDDGNGFFGAQPSATQSARDAALSSSVDVINAVIFDVQGSLSRAEDYYNNNIVGGPGGTVDAIPFPANGQRSPELTAAIESSITNAITAPTIAAAAAVPEPSSVLLILGSGLAFLVRRRR